MWTTYNVLTDTNILASTRKRTRWNISFLVRHLVSWRKQESGVGSLFLYMNQPCRIVLSVQIRGAIEVKKPLNGVWLWELITQIEPIFSCKWHLTREPYTLPLRDEGRSRWTKSSNFQNFFYLDDNIDSMRDFPKTKIFHEVFRLLLLKIFALDIMGEMIFGDPLSIKVQ